MRYTFISHYKSFMTDKLATRICYETNSEGLSELLEEFENFLKASGFNIDGKKLELIDEEDQFELD